MSIQHLLEDFAPALKAQAEPTEETESQDFLDAFEQGYKAGWEDAIRAKSEEHSSVSAELARNLQDMSFTLHEAQAAVLSDFSQVLEQIVEKTMPPLVHETLGLQIVEQLIEIAQEQEPTDVRICVSSEDLHAVQQLLPEHLTFPISVTSDPKSPPGKCQINFGSRERQIDVNEVLENLSQALAGFVHQSKKEVVNA